jgi:hypothetical protein
MAGVKMTGAEYTEFTAAEWGPDWYWDETRFLHNGVAKDDIGAVVPTDEVILVEGTIYKGQEANSACIDALPFARKWLKARAVTSLIVEVPNDQVAAFKADMKAKSFKVLS